MIILGIETSCDETAAAVVKDGKEILSNVVASSSSLHLQTGGIIPEVAAREQLKCIIPVVEEALRTACFPEKILNSQLSTFNFIDAIAVTYGPGLIGSLLVGVETAKTITYITGKPLVPVNHILAHIYANFLTGKKKHLGDDPSVKQRGCSDFVPTQSDGEEIGQSDEVISFPAVALVVSGGHTELFLMKSKTHIKWIGGTRDDAAGEAFDKTARLLRLGFPGGPEIAAKAAKSELRITNYELRLPRPMIHEDNLDFSFSGLKTAVSRKVSKLKTMEQWSNGAIRYLSYEIQEAITDVLVDKTVKAAKKYKVKSILLGGGVAANRRLKEKFESRITNHESRVSLFVPLPELCTDNAAYIASYAYYNYKPTSWKKIQARPSLSVEV